MKNSNQAIRSKIIELLEGFKERGRFLDLIDRSESVDLDQYVGHIDDSDYSLQDWTEAFLGFDEWLTERGISDRSFVAMLGYIHCCQMVIPETLERPCLQSVVIQCLSDYGFDAAQTSQE